MSVLTVLNTDAAATFIGETWPLTLAIFAVFVLSAIAPIVAVIASLVRRRRKPLMMGLAPVVAFAACYFTLALFPSREIVNRRLGEPLLVAEHEATAASVMLTLRPGNRFDVLISSLGTASFFPGTYERSGDDFWFRFSRRTPDGFADHARSRDGAIVFDSTSTGEKIKLQIAFPSTTVRKVRT